MRRLVASPQRASLLTPRSEPATPSFATVNGAEPEPEPESGPSPIGGTAPMGTVYLLEKVPMLTDLYHTMGGTILIRQAIQRGGGASLWSEDMKSEIKSVIVESMPAMLSAEERLSEADDVDDEAISSLEAAKAALVEEAIEAIQGRLKLHVENMLVESTGQIIEGTVAPALQGHLTALLEAVPRDQILSGEAAEEAEVRAALNEAENDKMTTEDNKYMRVMGQLDEQAAHLVRANETKTSEAAAHAAKMIEFTSAHSDQSAEGKAKVAVMRAEMAELKQRIDSLDTVISTYENNIYRLLVNEYPIAENVQRERRLQDAKLKLKDCGDLLNDPHPTKARKLLMAVWSLCKDHPTQLWAIVPIVYRMMMDSDILSPLEPLNRDECMVRLAPALAQYYQQHTELLYSKIQEADDAVATKAAIRRKTGEDGFEPRVSEGLRHCGVSCVSGLRHMHESDGYQIITNFRELIHSQWPLFIEEENLKRLCGDMRKLVQQARVLRIEIHYGPTVYNITQILRQRGNAFFSALEPWLHFTEEDKYDCIEKLDEFLTDIEHVCTQSDGPLTRGQTTVQSEAVAQARALYSESIHGGGGSGKTSDWTCCAKDCSNKIPSETVEGYKKKVAKKPWGANPDPARSRLLCSGCYSSFCDETKITMEDGTTKERGGGGGGSGGGKSKKTGKAARAEGKKAKKRSKAAKKEEKRKMEMAEAAAEAAVAALKEAQRSGLSRAAAVPATDANASAADVQELPSPAPAPAPATPPPSAAPSAPEGTPPEGDASIAEMAIRKVREAMQPGSQ